jgi:hypothetical protein
MKNFTLLFSALLLTAFSWQANAQCDHTFTVVDSYGDGWNGATVDLTVNGVTVLAGATAADAGVTSGSTEDILFSAATGDAITLTNWVSGLYDGEVSWEIKDGDGIVIAFGDYAGVPAVSGACPPPPPCNHIFTVMDSYGDGWNGATVDLTVNGVTVLAGATAADAGVTSGSTEDLLFSAATGDAITLTNWVSGLYDGEVSWEIKDGDGIVIAFGDYAGIPAASGACSSCVNCN